MTLLSVVAVAFLGGALLRAFGVDPPLEGLLSLIAFASASAALLQRGDIGRTRPRRRLTHAALVGAVGLSGWVAAAPELEPPPPSPGVYRIDGDVVRVRRGAHGPRAEVEIRRGQRVRDDLPLAPGLRVEVRGEGLPAGARVVALLTLRPRTRFRNPSPHAPWPVPGQAVADARLAAGSRPRIVERQPVRDVLEGARTHVRAALLCTLDERTAGVARALVLGEGDGVTEGDRAVVRSAGLAHILAVSGLHVSIVAGLLVFALRRALLRVPGRCGRLHSARIAAGAGIAFALAFAAFSGGAPSAWRAAVTASLGWALVVVGRRPDPVAVATAAMLLLAAATPAEVVRPAFLLSIVATAAVLGARPPRDSTVRERALAALGLSARTAVATAPAVIWCFGSIPALGVIANAFLVPVGSLLLVPLAVAHAAVASAAPPLAALTAPVLETVTAAFLEACGTFSAAGLGDALPPPSLAQALLLCAGAGAMLLLRRWRGRALCAALLALGLAASEAHLRAVEKPEGLVRVTFVDVGQGDAAIVDLPDGTAMLVDGGGAPWVGIDPGARAVVPLLAARRRDRLGAIVLTHPHPDHYEGLGAVLDELGVSELWDSGQAAAEDPGGTVARLLARARVRGARVIDPGGLCDRPRRHGRARIDVLAPCPRYDPGAEPNDNSLVLRVSIGRRAVLLAGDAEALEEGALVAAGARLGADVLKVGHHGSRTSSTEAFVRAVHPRVAVVSSGLHNRWDHPHAEALQRLTSAGARVLRLDREGGTVVTTDGETLEIRTWAGTRLVIP